MSGWQRRGKQRITPASPALCFCVSVTHWHSTALSSKLDGADGRGVKSRRRHEILLPFVRLHSVSLCLLLSLCFSNTLHWVWRNRLRKTSENVSTGWCTRWTWQETRTDISISIKKPHTLTVKVPCGSNTSPLINDAKMESLLDDHCKYRTH